MGARAQGGAHRLILCPGLASSPSSPELLLIQAHVFKIKTVK